MSIRVDILGNDPARSVEPARQAYLFPGQGSQRVGMGRDLAARHPDIAAWLRRADELLGFGVSRLMFSGPAEELRRTDVTQPAVYLASLITFDALVERLPAPAVVAGHSLGEYAALVAAGVLDRSDALLLVRRRGQLMAQVNLETPGAMVAALGIGSADVDRLCAQARADCGEVVEVANYNDDTQTVVSGTVAGVRRFRDLAGQAPALGAGAAGKVRLVPLEVGAPFHCSLMARMADEFAHDLTKVPFSDPKLPVISATTARQITTGAEARSALRDQLAGPVRWRATLASIASMNISAFIETGPGKVLTGICVRAYPQIPAFSTSEIRRLDQVLAAFA